MRVTTSGAACAELAASEQLAGTAVEARRWLLVERPGRWLRDAGDHALPPFDGRLMLIRRPDRRSEERVVLVAEASEEGGSLWRALSVDELERQADVTGPLILVCAHGRRDPCCARLGKPVFDALGPHTDPSRLFQSSHQGGHRFAANVLVLPAGVQLGRVSPADAARVAGLLHEGRIPLDLYRGRTLYPPLVQAAEVEVRRRHGIDAIGAVKFVCRNGAEVTFAHLGGEVTVHVEETQGPEVPPSCGAEPEPTTAYSVRW